MSKRARIGLIVSVVVVVGYFVALWMSKNSIRAPSIREVRAALDLPETFAALCMIPVGYPLGRFGPVTRKPLDEVMRFDRWS